jgi:methyl-accepting chemotaxis protein
VAVAGRSGRLLADLVPAIERTAQLTRGVAGSCREQATSVDQMNRAMSQVEIVTQRNASAAEELAATVEEIAGSAESLRDLVAYFRVEEARGGLGGARAAGAGSRAPTRDADGLRGGVARLVGGEATN